MKTSLANIIIRLMLSFGQSDHNNRLPLFSNSKFKKCSSLSQNRVLMTFIRSQRYKILPPTRKKVPFVFFADESVSNPGNGIRIAKL
jgi:hypothetical protein